MSTLTILTFVAVFVGVACLVGGVAVMMQPESDTAAEDRLQILTGAKKKNEGMAEGALLAQMSGNGASFATTYLSRFGNLQTLLVQADAGLDEGKFFLLTGGLMAAGAAAPLLLGLPVLLCVVLPVVLGFLPLAYVMFLRNKRLSRFGQQLPDALELIGRALRAGHSLGAAFHLVATEMSEPIRGEFARSYDEQNLGKPLEETLESMTNRVPNVDLRFFATAVILQRQTGGDLAEILDKIGHLIRERFKIWGQVQALTGEGRLSGIVLLALPPVLFVVMFRMNPSYTMVLFTDDMGRQMLAGALVMQLLGALVIRKIVNIKV